MSTASAIARVASFYENLDQRALQRIGEIYAPAAQFKDPFNEVCGVDAIAHVFQHMFATVNDPRFRVERSFGDGDEAMLVWVFSFGAAARRRSVRGVSHLRFDDRGRVVAHRDYWDPAEELYTGVPLLGGLMRWLRRRLSAGTMPSP